MKQSKMKTTIDLSHRYDGLLPPFAQSLFSVLGLEGQQAGLALSEGRFGDLVNLKIDRSGKIEWDVDEFRDAYLAVEVLSKYPFEIPGIDREKSAMDTFTEMEDLCARTNARLACYWERHYAGPSYHSVMSRARRLIEKCLGQLDMARIEERCSFTSGASTSQKRRCGDPYYKFGAEYPDVTSNCERLAEIVVRRIPRWHERLCLASTYRRLGNLFHLVPGNRITTVPKNAKTERTIAIEPDLNMFLQRGIGIYMRERLSRVGVDLRSQVRNQDLAMVGSFSGELTTLDLKGASDSVSLGLVELLLPQDWCALINMTRSPCGTLPSGDLIVYEKVSSMGNGYTFELESLIFWALCRSVMIELKLEDRRLAVYGDDLVFPVGATRMIREVLDFAGFIVNEEKSFSSGPFRESCGKHYWHGYDVTPFYVRKDLDRLTRVVSLANRIKEHGSLRFEGYGIDERFKETYDLVLRNIPKFIQRTIAGPSNLGDSVLWTSWDQARPAKAPRGWQGWRVTALVDVINSAPATDVPFLLRQLKALESRPSGVEAETGHSGIPDSFRKTENPCRLCKTTVMEWDDLGPWLGL